MGIRGAAVATLLGNLVSCVMAVYSICHKDQFLFTSLKQSWLPHKETFTQMFRLGRAVLVEQLFVRGGMLFYDMQIASLGTLEFATHQIVMKILGVTFSLGDGFSVAASSLVGQNLGKKRPDLAIIYSVAIQRIGLILSVVLALTIAIFRTQLLGILSMWNLDIIMTGQYIMFILAVCVLIQLIQVITIGSLRGAGDLKYVAVLMFISVAVIRPILAFALIYLAGLGLTGAWIAVLIDQIIRTTFSQHRFSSYKWLQAKV
jgi:Na+-driven multidrug efflux pump